MVKQKAYFFLKSQDAIIHSFVDIDIKKNDIYYFSLDDDSKNRFCISERTFMRETKDLLVELAFAKGQKSSLYLKKEHLNYSLDLEIKDILLTHEKIRIKYLLNEIEYLLKIELVGENMSIIKELEQEVKEKIEHIGYEMEHFSLLPSNRPDLGDYQINEAMSLAKKYHENPNFIAEKIAEELKKDRNFSNVSVVAPGFINLTLTNEFLLNSMNKIQKDMNTNIDHVESKKIMMDYGGANIAKTLHVGHLRSANIGEAVKRLARLLGHTVISDAHFGDIGRQSGMVISEIKRRYPNLSYFDEHYEGNYEDIDYTITPEELGEIYPLASTKAKEDESRMQEVAEITKQLEEGHKGYQALWNKIKDVSIEDIKEIYKKINTDFDLLEGESDCYSYIPETLEIIKNSGKLEKSEGAHIISVKKEEDNGPMPPLIVIQSNGSTLYATRELATLHSRIVRFSPEEIWYFADTRQALYFEQVFRASKLTKLADDSINLEFCGFGTMTGNDGRPFKTRDGGVMTLQNLITMVKEEILKHINKDIVKSDESEKIAEIVGIAALKYADFLSFRTKDYIFDPIKFTDVEGKTGPYLLYSTIRMKSLLQKADMKNLENISFKQFRGTSDRNIALTILKLPTILKKSLEVKSLNEIAEYIYKLTSLYNTFYAENKILTEENEDLKMSWIALTKVVYDTNMLLLDTLGIEVPEKM